MIGTDRELDKTEVTDEEIIVNKIDQKSENVIALEIKIKRLF